MIRIGHLTERRRGPVFETFRLPLRDNCLERYVMCGGRTQTAMPPKETACRCNPATTGRLLSLSVWLQNRVPGKDAASLFSGVASHFRITVGIHAENIDVKKKITRVRKIVSCVKEKSTPVKNFFCAWTEKSTSVNRTVTRVKKKFHARAKKISRVKEKPTCVTETVTRVKKNPHPCFLAISICPFYIQNQ
jgi:hypothetical protein